MVATKALLRHGLREKLDVALESESLLLIQHWCSSECQEAIKVYIEEKGQ
jgi:chromodomain protein Y